ncbi:N-acetylmuramoyl-L-alanine amidase, family 2 [Synechococcus sp. WH 8109]|uniref:N-acetylmuramoyl-L-alanine amidase n=1 Tax=Synechococcus sp. WH 8109 TaxID=166314 RepID=UPI000301E654|nr:peptidoglycan recognition family protein [Synechococcus sp. WH 8109]AHF63647.1 N-acetylmuramoyl-L-alanine amidase, family 2 [Synechococcus sp. WH 8109]
MVRDRLSHFCTSVWNRVELHRPLAISVAAAGTLALGLTSLLLMDQGELSPVGIERGRQREDNPSSSVPLPPKSRSWRSPLARQCSGVDTALRSRLNQLDARSNSWRAFVKIDPTNFGERYHKDAYGRVIDATPRVVVLHETVYSMSSALNTFMTPHPRDEDQVSYHTLVGQDGRVLDLVDPLSRAYGAGFSAFLGEWAITNKKLKGSVNNFALHLSLESPPSGANANRSHVGYTSKQYDALALVLSGWIRSFNLPPAAITTHRHVDVGGERDDPRSFDWSKLQTRLAALGDLCVT